jgi:hypothetical protein
MIIKIPATFLFYEETSLVSNVTYNTVYYNTTYRKLGKY